MNFTLTRIGNVSGPKKSSVLSGKASLTGEYKASFTVYKYVSMQWRVKNRNRLQGFDILSKRKCLLLN